MRSFRKNFRALGYRTPSWFRRLIFKKKTPQTLRKGKLTKRLIHKLSSPKP